MKSAGGWKAIGYTLQTANRVGWLALWRAMRSKNACKTCALGMGGQMGGMVNEAGHFPEVCKKSLQAMAAGHAGRDLAGVLRALFHRPAPDAVAARARIVRHGSSIRSTPARARRTTASSRGTRRSTRLAATLKASRPGAQLLLRQRPIVERSRIPAAALRAGVRDQLRQQLLVLLPSGERRRPGSEPRHRARRPSSSTTSSAATSTS